MESLSWIKLKTQEMMASKISSSSSNPTSHRTRHIQGAIAHMSRRHGYMLQHMRKSFMHRHDMNNLVNKLEEILREVVPKMVDNTIDQNMQENLPWLVKKALRQERENAKAELASMVSTDISNNVPIHIDAFIRNYMNNDILHMHPTSSSSSLIPDLQQQLYLKMRDDEQAQQDHEDHHDDDARLMGENSAKRQRTSEKEYDPWSEDQVNDDDEVPSKEVTPKFLAKISRNGKKWVPTSNDQQRMQDIIDDIIRSRCNSREEHAYHLDQMKRYMENKIVWESRAEDLTLHVPNKPPLVHAFPFLENDLEELKSRRVRKVIKRFNMQARYAVEHWKHLWAKISYIKGQLVTRSNPNDVYSNQKIVEVIRIQCDQGHGQEFMKEIIVSRADEVVSSGKELMIISLVWKVINSRRVMDIDKIPKFYNATLKRVLVKVKKINLDVKHGYENPSLSDQDAELIKFYEAYIQDCLKHRDQMRRRESYVNGRPL
ncbi:hypothetical protein Tco_0057600 [Tanacetum coccineum]